MEDSYESMQQEDQNDLQMDDLQAQPETTAAEPPEDLSLEEGAPIAGAAIMEGLLSKTLNASSDWQSHATTLKLMCTNR